jgi:hypothetical protein
VKKVQEVFFEQFLFALVFFFGLKDFLFRIFDFENFVVCEKSGYFDGLRGF